jgi:hypothetical protein
VSRRILLRCSRAFGVLVVLTAWFAVSNHCALLAMQHAAQAEKQCCHAPSTGSPAEPGSGERVCCKSLRVLPLEAGTKLVEVQAAHELFDAAWAVWREATWRVNAPILELQPAEPPWLLSYAEAVLQRSVLSHAPPFVV